MIRYIKFSLLACLAIAAMACSDKQGDVLLIFVEQEPGVAPYQTRLIVTPEFMRFDDGEGSADFVLYDRRNNIIYSTNSDERTVMSVAQKKTDDIKPPYELKHEVKNLGTLKDAPEIGNKKPTHYQFITNGVHCYDVVAVKGLMPDVVTALMAFQDLLASDSRLTFNNTPADMHDTCDMAMSTFASGRHLQYGFPVQEWTPAGTGRSLIDFNTQYKADSKLFVLPENYKLYSVQDYREGKVSFE